MIFARLGRILNTISTKENLQSYLNTGTFTNKNREFWISGFENFIIVCNIFSDAGGRGRSLTKMNSNLFQVTSKVAGGGHSRI